jgi:feruloyl esterase
LPGRWRNRARRFPGAEDKIRGSNARPLEQQAVTAWRGVPGRAGAIARPEFARGYVTFDCDNGNGSGQGLEASFALNEEQFRNFAGEQLKKTHDAVMYLVKERYGITPLHSYFTGGSEGGREAFAAIQRYPEDYDGVVAIAPAHDITAIILKWQMIRRAMRLNNSAGWISKTKAGFLRKRELSACDKLDGLEDSIISHGEACRINFQDLRCPGGKDFGSDCFSDAQLTTLQTMHSNSKLPYALANGETNLPGYLIGADYGIKLTDLNYSQVVDTFVRYFFLRDPKADSLAFDPLQPGRWLARVQAVSMLLDTTSPDVDRFIARGGKWIVVQGRSDPGVPPTGMIEYYQRLVAKYGQAQTDDFLRFYLIPGMGHGEGLSFNAHLEPLDALEAWVERGVAAATLTATDANPEAHGRSRPMCVYPKWPKYKGVGDSNLAGSFVCAVDH